MDRTKKLAIISVLALIAITAGVVYSDPTFVTGSIKKLTPKKNTVVVKRAVAPEKLSVFPTINTNPTTSVPVVPVSSQTIGTTATVTAEALGFDQLQALKHYTDSSSENKQIIDLLNQVLTAVKNQPAPSVVYQQIPVQTPAPVAVPTPTPALTPEPIPEPEEDTLENGLVGYWTFDEGSGAVAADTSGNNNSGIVEGEPTWVPGKVGGALYFDGSITRVIVPDSDSLDVTKDVTLSLWVNPSKITECYADQLMQKSSNPGNSNFNLYYFGKNNNTASTVLLYANVGKGWGWKWINNTTKIDLNKWQHLAITYKSGEGIAYLDGVATKPVETTQGDLTANAEPLYMGYASSAFSGTQCPGGAFFNGYMDDVRIYNRVLSPKEISQLAKMK